MLKFQDVNQEQKVGKQREIEQHDKTKLKLIPPIITTFSA